MELLQVVQAAREGAEGPEGPEQGVEAFSILNGILPKHLPALFQELSRDLA
jgi:hypothetical protein